MSEMELKVSFSDDDDDEEDAEEMEKMEPAVGDNRLPAYLPQFLCWPCP